MDEDTFQQRWPDATIKLAGRKSFIGISNEEHKRLRKVTKTPINGHEALSIYVPNIEANVVSALEKWSQMVPDRTPEDDEGKKLDNEEIIDTLIGYLNAGHESSAHVTTWATMFLQTHPEDFKKAKVVDETLRIVSLSFMTFREAKKDVDFKGCL
ncbi:hypothetical protein L1987_56874 [Smallanthus sonchifolius]|uniref:Uncharacterized protein n=1 Tax=Smallanthus sonchifolius TaxID=185202 RepID=A0ACB9DB96_9ASTR|nr:hypothetical protein L1987_56874 [Smallanthus sonchifolius]